MVVGQGLSIASQDVSQNFTMNKHAHRCPQDCDELDHEICRLTDSVTSAIQQCPGRIAVLGAGGKMGFHFCRMLQNALDALGRTDPVMAVSRFGSERSRQQFQEHGFQVISADMTDPQQVANLPLAENVFFLAGIKFGSGHQPELLQLFNVEMPRLVASHYRDSRFVALSTGCVYAFTTPESGGSTEDSPTAPPGAYAESCLGREQAFVDAAHDYGTRSSLIRLNYSIDLRYGVLVDVCRRVLHNEPVNVDMGYANVIWQGDAISHAIQTLPLATAPPLIMNITGPEIVRIRDLATMFGQRLKRDVQIVGQEQPTAWLSNAQRSHQLFGTPAMPLDRMVNWVAEWLQNDRETLNKPTHFETRDGNY